VKRTWTTHDYSNGDEEGIESLYRETFPEGSKSYHSYWKWEYAENPVKVKLIRIARDDSKRIIGHYAVSPRKMYINGKTSTCSLSLDTMTHPDFRKQGMFTLLARELYADLEKKEIDLTFGFPNMNSVHGFEKKLDWYIFGEVPLLIRPINTLNVFKFFDLPVLKSWPGSLDPFFPLKFNLPYHKALRGCKWTELSRFGPEADDLWEAMRAEFSVAADRGASYLNWRYSDKPDEKYLRLGLKRVNGEYLGLLVLKVQNFKGLKLGIVADIISRPGILLRTAIAGNALTRLAQMGADVAMALCAPFTPLFWPYVLNLFIPAPSRFNPIKRYWGVRRNTMTFSPKLILDRKNWLVSWGDTDVI
jgi:hypothetical protein